ncbi:wiskott-Aldrich syndrome protein homolog 1-like [Cervus canadensis]|uniref:wiskott-Aldrich syndrome protein homolog 1-like n=1 Tax=Cervus canadensis TaxID=1574408 RepID=UPI001C9E2777|nr:wiskott-Aldrich syndrome protein homolog 1-like [Cervus canadensis]
MIDEQHHPKLTDCQARLLPLDYFSLEFLAQREQSLLSPPMDFSIEALEEEKKRDQQAFFLKAMRRGSFVGCACIGLCLCLHGSSSCVYLSSWLRLTGGWHFSQEAEMPADRQSGSAVAGSHPSEAPSVAGNSSASRFWCPERGPGLIPPESIGEAHPAQTVGRRDPAAVCLHPTPAPCCGWRLRVAGCFLLPGWVGGDPESPHAAPRSARGFWARSSRHASSRPSWSPGLPPSQKAPSASAVASVSGQSGDPPAPSLGTASSSPSAYPAHPARPHQGGLMHAPSLLANIRVWDPAASSGEAPTPEPAKPSLREGGVRQVAGSWRAGVAARERRTGGLLRTQRHPHPRTIAAGKAKKRKGLPGLNRSLGAQGAAGHAKKPTQCPLRITCSTFK